MSFDEVRGLELFDDLSDELLHAMLETSAVVSFAEGDVLWVEKEPAVFWWVLLEGRLEVVRHVGRETAVMATFDRPGHWGGGWAAFDPHGVYLVTGIATAPGRMLRVPVAALRELVEKTPVVRHLIDGLFHTGREIESTTRQREALVALGTLSAGLAHELNNPAAAASRAVDVLDASMSDVFGALRALAAHGVAADQFSELDSLRREAEPRGPLGDPIATADREEALSTWMIDHRVDRDWILAPVLAAASFDPAWCGRVLDVVGQEALQAALDWVSASAASGDSLGEIKESTHRISELVAAVKSYSQMDRGSLQRIDVTEGLESTLVMLAHKLRSGVTVERQYSADVPLIDAYAGELNQVWTNLIDNAIDAMEGQGTLTLSTSVEGDRVRVEIGDTGTGMTPEVAERVFEVFFTTKGVGSGTGLGLDVARRIVVERHGGDISVDSAPGRTVFGVSLPTH